MRTSATSVSAAKSNAHSRTSHCSQTNRGGATILIEQKCEHDTSPYVNRDGATHPDVDANRTRVPVARVPLVVVSPRFVSNGFSCCPPHGAVKRGPHPRRRGKDCGTGGANAFCSEPVQSFCVPAVRWYPKTRVGRLEHTVHVRDNHPKKKTSMR